MPEGDTIFVAARTLDKALSGRVLTGYSTTIDEADGDLVGRAVTRVEPRGKNVLMHFDDGRVLHSHMMMNGSWHIYRPGEKWQKPEHRARVVLETDKFVAVCFDADDVSLMSPRGVARDERLAALGPDILVEEDATKIVPRLRARGDLPIGVALLYQALVAGIGNVYKSEALFVARVDPFVRGDALDDETLEKIVAIAAEMMRANLAGERRKTRPRGGYHVYGRSGLPCFECGTRIEMRRQGDQGRSTYFCPSCQRS